MPASEHHPLLYEFGHFTVDPQRRLLFVSGAQDPVDLPPRAFEALLYLVERPGELLTKRELLAALWPNVIVEENSLNQVISLVRKVLGEKPSEHRFIVTAPGRGYRFVAAVRVRGGPKEAAPRPDPLSIAVLPFADHGAQTGYLGEAIAADLIRLLSARSRMSVTAHTSSSIFRGPALDVRQIARTLNVSRVLDGQVTREGEHLTVTARLFDGVSGRQLRTVQQRRLARDLGDLQAELAREVAWTLDPTAPAAIGKAPAVSPEAYMQYLRALSLSTRPTADSVMTAITLLKEAVSREPAFSRAKSLLAIQYTSCVMFGLPLPGALDLARHEAAGALMMDDQNGETHCAAAVIDCLGGAWSRAEERFRIAHTLTADPLVSGLRCAYLSLSVGQLERAFQQAEHALRVAPTHPIGVHMLASLHMMRGEDERALAYAHLAVELGQSRSMAPLADIFAELALRAGRFAEAAEILVTMFPARLRTSGLSRTVQLLLGLQQSGAGRQAAAALRAVEASLSPAELDPPMRKRLLVWYCLADALDEAFEIAFKSLDHYTRDGTVGGAWGVLWVPALQPFRDDDRFQVFARRLRLLEYWSEYGPPDGYSLEGDRLLKVT